MLAEIALPDFGMPTVEPLLPPSIFAERVERLRARMDERGYDQLVVWADREHSANVAYLTGFDPRFEEAVLVVGAEVATRPCWWATSASASAEAAPLPLRCLRFQDLSLPAQPRDTSLPLAEILGAEGITVGTAGSASSAGRHTPAATRSRRRRSWSTSCAG